MPKSQFPGTTYEKSRGRWKAQGRINGVTKSLGYFATQEEAYAAVVLAKKEVGTLQQQLQLLEPAPALNQLQVVDSQRGATIAPVGNDVARGQNICVASTGTQA
jgi:hypothetical protein